MFRLSVREIGVGIIEEGDDLTYNQCMEILAEVRQHCREFVAIVCNQDTGKTYRFTR